MHIVLRSKFATTPRRAPTKTHLVTSLTTWLVMPLTGRTSPDPRRIGFETGKRGERKEVDEWISMDRESRGYNYFSLRSEMIIYCTCNGQLDFCTGTTCLTVQILYNHLRFQFSTPYKRWHLSPSSARVRISVHDRWGFKHAWVMDTDPNRTNVVWLSELVEDWNTSIHMYSSHVRFWLIWAYTRVFWIFYAPYESGDVT
jgi:hypothetical protein